MAIKLAKPVGLFLCGGGALGSWQSGVLDRLVRGGVTFDVVAGFSVGSLNGAAYCYNKTGELGGIWRTIKPGGIFDFRPRYCDMPLELYQHHSSDLLSSAGFLLQNRLAKFSLFSNKPVYSFLDGWLSRSGLAFKRNVKFYVISHAVEMKLPYISLFDGAAGGAGPLSFVDALTASCAIPLIFPPVKVSERGRDYHLVDGGVTGIATINLNIFEGCKTVVMISNTRPEDHAFTGKGLLGYFETKVRRMLALHTDKIYESRVFIKSSPQTYLIAPPADLGVGVLEFEGEKCARAFAIGDEEGGKFLQRLS